MELAESLPVIFAGLMALAILIYALLDGYDLGVGLLLLQFEPQERDQLLASIGPFWDANETWLVLAVGLLLIAFPTAHSLIFGALYLPVLVLLVGLILRGVAFDFRAKVPGRHKAAWDRIFFTGSGLATGAQGYMLGQYIVGFADGWLVTAFVWLSALCVSSAYAFIGSAWLVMKCEADTQLRAARWARRCLWLMMLGIISVSVVNPLVSDVVFDKWFSFPAVILLAPIPLLCGVLMLGVAYYLNRFLRGHRSVDWLPFAAAVVIFFLCFQGLAYSFYPYVVPGQLTFWDAAAATESLTFVGVGVIFVLPAILFYTAFAYRVFWGKARALTYS